MNTACERRKKRWRHMLKSSKAGIRTSRRRRHQNAKIMIKDIAKILSACRLGRFARRGRSVGVRSWELRRDDAVRHLTLRANN